ncbi:conserved hypothetical protein [Neospora caninum Liverpool]|uniref:Uncharacterized protein n=1 Tax=Neospora caninum (strain Liverpool) TaxID=572307 RepID=F0V976_NEOCL|nr:conserved hypothetical protein [Neospora caninum Liverpool]CBZ50301.1 conserved hypothetical protein [Neospora caninum Liverpool]|eukprot:XP_003880335.1 conserved hypothetical protein [Neospora caninum Liverpool]
MQVEDEEKEPAAGAECMACHRDTQRGQRQMEDSSVNRDPETASSAPAVSSSASSSVASSSFTGVPTTTSDRLCLTAPPTATELSLQASHENAAAWPRLCFFVRHEVGDESNQRICAREANRESESAPFRRQSGDKHAGKPWHRKPSRRGGRGERGSHTRNEAHAHTPRRGGEGAGDKGADSGVFLAREGDSSKESLAASPETHAGTWQKDGEEARPGGDGACASVSSPVSARTSSSGSSSVPCAPSSSSLTHSRRDLPVKSGSGEYEAQAIANPASGPGSSRGRFSLVYLHPHPDGVVASLPQLCASACSASAVLRALWHEHPSEAKSERNLEKARLEARDARGYVAARRASKAETADSSLSYPSFRTSVDDVEDALRRSMENIGAVTREASAALAGQPGYVEKQYMLPPVDLGAAKKKEETQISLATRFVDSTSEGRRPVAVPLTLTEHYAFRQFNGLVVVGLSARGLSPDSCTSGVEEQHSSTSLPSSSESAARPPLSSSSSEPASRPGRPAGRWWRRVHLAVRDGVSRNCVSGKRKKGAFFLQADTLVAVLSFEERISFSDKQPKAGQATARGATPAPGSREGGNRERHGSQRDRANGELHAASISPERSDGDNQAGQEGQAETDEAVSASSLAADSAAVSAAVSSPPLAKEEEAEAARAGEECQDGEPQIEPKKRGKARRRKRPLADNVVLWATESGVEKRERDDGEDQDEWKRAREGMPEDEGAEDVETDEAGRRWQWLSRRVPIYACIRGMLLEFNSAVVERPELLLSQFVFELASRVLSRALGS